MASVKASCNALSAITEYSTLKCKFPTLTRRGGGKGGGGGTNDWGISSGDRRMAEQCILYESGEMVSGVVTYYMY